MGDLLMEGGQVGAQGGDGTGNGRQALRVDVRGGGIMWDKRGLRRMSTSAVSR
jgi:hypothetical protein